MSKVSIHPRTTGFAGCAVLSMRRAPRALSMPLVFAVALTACAAPEPTFHADRVPKQLSEWAMLVQDGETLEPNAGVIPFDLNTALFSDHAHKLRTVWMPDGTRAQYDNVDTFDFPVGTVITKTFFYPVDPSGAMLKTSAPPAGTSTIDLAKHRIIETRLLVHRETGWIALPYVWNDEQTEATFAMIGKPMRLALADPTQPDQPAEPFIYLVPDTNQCAGCHATNHTSGTIEPIGPKARHLNRDFAYHASSLGEAESVNQLAHWTDSGLLDGAPASTSAPANAFWTGDAATLEAAAANSEALNELARSYLDVNCSHCHNANGPADTSGLLLDRETTGGFQLGLCKPPVAAGRGTQDRLYAIFPGRADLSILPARMNSLEPDVAMPELGRGTIHHQGVALLEAWINSLPGDC